MQYSNWHGVVIDISLEQPICYDVMLICINLLTFIAVIYSYKILFLLIFTSQICVLENQNSLAPGEGGKTPSQTPPLDAFGVSILGAYGASNFNFNFNFNWWFIRKTTDTLCLQE